MASFNSFSHKLQLEYPCLPNNIFKVISSFLPEIAIKSKVPLLGFGNSAVGQLDSPPPPPQPQVL